MMVFKQSPRTNDKRQWLASNAVFQFIMQLNKKAFQKALKDFLRGHPDSQSLYDVAMCMYKENREARTMPFFKLVK